MSFINILSILGVGYLIILHIYLMSQGLSTYEYVKKSQDEVTTKEKKARAEESQESSDSSNVANKKSGHYDISIVARRVGRRKI
jgi:uncharacterized membrane protein